MQSWRLEPVEHDRTTCNGRHQLGQACCCAPQHPSGQQRAVLAGGSVAEIPVVAAGLEVQL